MLLLFRVQGSISLRGSNQGGIEGQGAVSRPIPSQIFLTPSLTQL